MNYIILFISFFMFETARCEDQSDEINHPERHGYSKAEIKKAIKEKRKHINPDAIAKDIAYTFEAKEQFAAAQYTDEAVENIVLGIVQLLKQKGFNHEAHDIEEEFYSRFQGEVSKQVANFEMGDYAPLSKFLVTVHDKAHALLGEFLCKMSRVHDIWVLNYAIPVMFAPSKYSEKEYLDSFHGHPFLGPIWIHRGGLPIITYWVINGVCGGLTAGMGWISFVCGPIAGLGQTITENYFSEDIGRIVWKRANPI